MAVGVTLRRTKGGDGKSGSKARASKEKVKRLLTSDTDTEEVSVVGFDELDEIESVNEGLICRSDGSRRVLGVSRRV